MIKQIYFDKVKTYYLGNSAKTWLWFKTRNPVCGGLSPLEMIKSGREKKLEKVIDNMVKGIWP